MKAVNSALYNKEYYLSGNAGYQEFKAGLGRSIINKKYKRVLDFCSFTPNDIILDIGCGRGELAYYAIKHGCRKAIGIDYSKDAIDIANDFKKRLNSEIKNCLSFLHIDANELSENEQFDYIFMVEIWEHLYDHQLIALLKKVKKILNNNGVLMLTTPNGLYERYFYTVKRIVNIPFNLFKFPVRLIRGKWTPKSFYDVLRNIFKIRPFDSLAAMHVNISSPLKIKRMLRSAGFHVKIRCFDSSKNLLSLIFSRWMGREVVIIAKKSTCL